RIGPGITTEQINDWVHEETLANNAYPAPLNYRGKSAVGFPKSVCTSVNNVICHGIPGNEVLKEGDIINVDVTSILDGYYGDASRMFLIGDVSEEAKNLVDITQQCLQIGIQQVKPGKTTGDIGHAIQTHAEGLGYSVVRDFAGHGVGIEFHEEPQILHYGKPNTGALLQPNMVFTIEPMINIGRPECKLLRDGWTAVTQDGSLSAQWEHTIRVTSNGSEILTA
ncbi:MAG: type I methionyl aminopeptidase, partial [SAR324 cluster bacterium]|nr:type I methionyl aminopeptidase [SAR324 cluster bacterium]